MRFRSDKPVSALCLARLTGIVLALNLFFFTNAYSQVPDYDEVSIFLNVQNIDNTEMPALIKGETAFLPLNDIFDFLKIANLPSRTRDTISGFFITEANPYLVDAANHRIRINDKLFELKPGDLVKTENNLYLEVSLFSKIFGLNCTFSFRSLAVTLTTDIELPVMREMRLNQMRNNLTTLKGQQPIDTVVKRSYPLFHFGAADWSVINARETYFGSDTRVNLGLGGIVAGGETNVLINYHTGQPLIERNQYYSWRLANNDRSALRQLVAGKVYGQSTSSIYSPIVGLMLTNMPTTFRRSYGTYRISNTTQPNWTVELYVNNLLISFVKADAAGFYTFEVPLAYGNSQVKLRFYGPNGEERNSQQNISVPFNFLPPGEFEYSAVAGIVEDEGHSRFSRVNTNYGVNNMVTVGGGVEYLSSVRTGATMPFLTTSIRTLNSLLFSGEHTFGVRTKALATYRFVSGMQIEMSNTWFKKGQQAINNTALQERRGIISAPLRAFNNRFAGYTRLSINQFRLPMMRYTTTEWLISGMTGGINPTINTFALFNEQSKPYYYSNISVAKNFRRLVLTQHIQYEYRGNRLISLKEELERRFLKTGYLNLAYERNFYSNIQTLELGFRYDVPFAQTGSSVRRSRVSTRFLQSASGSLVVDRPTHYTGVNNIPSVGRSGITIAPFLDLNVNGKRDADEPRAPGLKIRVNAGRVKQVPADTTIRITGLESYANYTVELDALSFDNIAWQLPKRAYSVAVDPNKVKLIEVPIRVSSEVSGRVSIRSDLGTKGQGRLIVVFQKRDGSQVIGRTISEEDGYFTFFGLSPGNYVARVDSDQLKKLNLGIVSTEADFTVKRTAEGAVLEGLEIVLGEIKNKIVTPVADSLRTDSLAKSPAIAPVGQDSLALPPVSTIEPGKVVSKQVPPVPKRKVLTKGPDGKVILPPEYDITLQVAHFKYRKAKASMDYLHTKFGYNSLIRSTTNGYFNVRITGVPKLEKAREVIRFLKTRGFPDAYILERRRPSRSR